MWGSGLNAVGVGVGGTAAAAGVVSPEGKVLAHTRHPTPHSPEKLVEVIVRAIREVMDGHEVGGVCLAVPGLILAQENRVVFSPNLHAIEGIPLKDRVEPEIGASLATGNDGSAAAWGAFRFGAGSEVDHLVFLTLGTGIGGGVISHGVLLPGAQGAGGGVAARAALRRGAQGAGGELGHVPVHATGPRCACGNRGCLEALASGTSIGRRAREAAVEKPGSALGRIASRRKLLGEDVTELALQGDGGGAPGFEAT